MLCYMHRDLDKFGTKLFRLNYLQVIHCVFGWHMSSVKTLIKKMLLGDSAGWGLFLSIGLILLFRGVEPRELLMWTLATFTLRTEGEWKGVRLLLGRGTWIQVSDIPQDAQRRDGQSPQMEGDGTAGRTLCQNSSKGFWGTASALLALWSSLHKGCLSRLSEVHPEKAMFLSIPCYKCTLLCVVAFFFFFWVNNYLIMMNWLFFN